MRIWALRCFASVESILGSGINLVPESQYRMPRLHLSPCFALRCWKLLKWDLSFWYFWYFWVVDIVLATSNQLPAQQAPRRMALGCQLACSKELKSVPEAGTLEKKKKMTVLASQWEYNGWDMPEDCTANSSSASSDSSKRALAQDRYQVYLQKLEVLKASFFVVKPMVLLGHPVSRYLPLFCVFFFAPCGSCHGAILHHPRMIHLQKHHRKWIWVQLRSPIDYSLNYSTLRWQIFAWTGFKNQ